MKKNMFSVLAVASISLLAFTGINELPIGAAMPKAEVKMKDVSGKEVTLRDAAKKNGLLVMFSCNTCPYVIKNQQRTTEVANYANTKDIGIILVNSNEGQRSDDDSYAAMQQYAKKHGYKWNYVVDENSVLADAFGAKKTPECYLFNKAGKLVYHGAIDDNPSNESAVSRKHLKEAMDQLLKGEEISVKTSKSVGCSIKRL
jgi:peroxiredoxin